MKATARLAITVLGAAPIVAAFTVVPEAWRSAALAIVGGVSGVIWSGIQYLDQTRVGPPAKRGFVTLFFAIYAFGCLAVAEVVDTAQGLSQAGN